MAYQNTTSTMLESTMMAANTRFLFLRLAILAALSLPGSGQAQVNQCRTAPVGTSSPSCASEAFVTQSAAAAGNVRGPNSSIPGHIATFADGTGKLLADGGAPFTSTPTATSLGGDVLLNNTASYFDGPSIAQGTVGTWFASGTVTVTDTSGPARINAKLWDGTTIIASASMDVTGASANVAIALSGYIASPAANIRISVKDGTSTSGKILFNFTGTSKDSTLSVFRLQ
jgi:hypothetical protein